MAIKQDLTEEQIIGEIETALREYNLGDIKKVCAQKLTIAGFILGSCLIDHMAGFRYERKAAENGKVYGSRQRYVDFVNAYMNKYGYQGEKFYDQLRCKIVHAYIASDSAFAFRLMHSNEEIQHGRSQPVNRERLNLVTFVRQLEEVLTLYIEEIKSNKEIRDVATQNYRQFGIFSRNS